MTREKHYRVGKRFTVKIVKHKGVYSWAVYPNGLPGVFIASSDSPTLAQARKEAREMTVVAVRRIRKTKSERANLNRILKRLSR